MNDYLTNLAARSINLAPALQPRLHSQFEPGPRNGVFNSDGPHAAMQDEAAFAEERAEAENELPPFRARHNPNHHTRETIAPAAPINESIAPVLRETPAAPQELLINSFEAVQKGETVLRQAQHERENRTDFRASSVRPESPPTQFILSEVEGLRTSFDKPRTGSVEGWTEGFSTASQPREKVAPSLPAISLIDADRPHTTEPDEAALAVESAESENEPPVRAHHNSSRHVRKSIAPAAHIDESIVPSPHETSASPQLRENVTNSPPALSFNGKLTQPQLTIHPPEPVGPVYTAIREVTAVDSRARVTPSLSETVKAPQTEIPSLPSPRTNDTESSRLAEERQTQTIRREQLVVTEVIRQSASDQGPILPRTVVMEESLKMHGRPQKQSAERQPQTISREQPIVTEMRRQSDPERGSIRPQATVTELPPKAHGHPQVQPAVFPPILVQPSIVPHFENRHDDRLGRSDDHEAPPTPTINVTIGRIEVRAAQPTSSSSPKPRPAPPVMSLDEYLRRRGNGGAG